MTFDLSAITDSLIGQVKTQWAAAPLWSELGGATPGPSFTPNLTGLAPDAARDQPGPQLGLYLYHVESNNAAAALFWQPQMQGTSPGQPVRFLPLALDLYYLLFAYSESSYIEEQEAMSVAMRIFHSQPVVRSAPSATVPWELTVTLEHRSYDELSLLWQATTAPLRMSLVYRAAVVFLDPDEMPDAPEQTTSFNVGVGRLDVAAMENDDPTLIGSLRDVEYAGPADEVVAYAQSPATAAAGQLVYLIGSGLGGASSDTVYLLDDSGDETDVTSWAVPASSSPAKTALQLPATMAAAPAGTPPAGNYQFRIGHGALGAAGSFRTDATPVAVAAFVDPTGGPLLSGTPPYTVNGAGFAGDCEVLVGSIPLARVTQKQGPGQATIRTTGLSFTFTPPPGPGGTVVPLRVIVAGIESDAALWVTM